MVMGQNPGSLPFLPNTAQLVPGLSKTTQIHRKTNIKNLYTPLNTTYTTKKTPFKKNNNSASTTN